MKIFFSFLAVFLITCSPVKADWLQTFRSIYVEDGIDTTVVTALGEGIAPDQIMKYCLTLEELAPSELIKALFCSLVQPTIINEAAEANHVPESTVSEGYQLALAQCAAEMEEQANVAPVPAFSGAPPVGKVKPSQASPWNFN